MDLGRIRLVVLDIDGTIRTAEDPECAGAERALAMLDVAGVPWTFSTGRPYGGMMRVTAGLFADGRRVRRPTSNLNGCLVHVPGIRPRSTLVTMGSESIAGILRLAFRERMAAMVFSCRVEGGRPVETVRSGGYRPETWSGGDRSAGVPEAHDAALGHDEGVTSVVMRSEDHVSAARVARLQDSLGDAYQVSSADGAYFEVTPAGVTKGASLAALAATMGFATHEVMAVGNGLNDVEMLALAGVGVAVANAPLPVREAADVVVAGRAAAGVEEAVRMLVGGRATGPCP